MTPRSALSLAGVLLLTLPAISQNDVSTSAGKPVAVWRFTSAAEPGVSKTVAKSLEPGPRAPTYPAFPVTNTAMAFTAITAETTGVSLPGLVVLIISLPRGKSFHTTPQTGCPPLRPTGA